MEEKVSIFAVLTMCVVLTVPAFASSNLQETAPSVPTGFTYKYSLERDSEAEAKLVNGVLVVTAFIPGFGTTVSIIGAIQFIDSWNQDPNLQSTYTDYVYEAENPEAEYGVPYVYWHKMKMYYKTSDNKIEVRWGSYYEYAVAPRGSDVLQQI